MKQGVGVCFLQQVGVSPSWSSEFSYELLFISVIAIVLQIIENDLINLSNENDLSFSIVAGESLPFFRE